MAEQTPVRRIFKIVLDSMLEPRLWIIEKAGDPDYLCRVVKFDSSALADMAGDLVDQARRSHDRADHLLTAAADLGSDEEARVLADMAHAANFLSEGDDEALQRQARTFLKQLDGIDPIARSE